MLKSPPFICVVALLLRVVLLAALGTYHKDSVEDHIQFGYETGRVARSIVQGQGISSPFMRPTGPTGVMMPLLPYLLAGVFKLFGVYTDASGFAILCLSSLFSALTCWAIVRIGELTFAPAVALISAWVWALHPVAIFISIVRIWETTLGTLLLTLALYMTLRLQNGARAPAWTGFGLLCGLTVLTNPSAAAVLPLWGAWLWRRLSKRHVRAFAPLALAALAFLVCVSPWFIRNYRVFHRLVPFRTNFGLELQIGNNPWALGGPDYDLHPIHNPQEFARYQQMGELAYIAGKKREAYDFIAGHKPKFAWLTLARIVFFWTFLWEVRGPGVLALLAAGGALVGFGLQTFLAFLGLGLAFRAGNDAAWPFAALFAVFPLVYYITFAQLRFRHPLEPAMVLLCVYAVRGIFRSRGGAQELAK